MTKPYLDLNIMECYLHLDVLLWYTLEGARCSVPGIMGCCLRLDVLSCQEKLFSTGFYGALFAVRSPNLATFCLGIYYI